MHNRAGGYHIPSFTIQLLNYIICYILCMCVNYINAFYRNSLKKPGKEMYKIILVIPSRRWDLQVLSVFLSMPICIFQVFYPG